MDVPTILSILAEHSQANLNGPTSSETEPSCFRVYGTVVHPNGQLGSGLRVVANDRDLRSLQALGRAITDKHGAYSITYTNEEFSRHEKDSADLLMQVFREEVLLYQTPMENIRFNAPSNCEIDIRLLNGDTYMEDEYSRIVRLIRPVLGDVTIDALQENSNNQDITFLSGELAIDATKLEHFAVAQKLASSVNIPAEFFYGLFAENTLVRVAPTVNSVTFRFSVDLTTNRVPLFYDIVLLPSDTIASAISKATIDLFIPGSVLEKLPAITKALATYKSDAEDYTDNDAPQQLWDQVEEGLLNGSFSRGQEVLESSAILGDLPALISELRTAFKSPQKRESEPKRLVVADTSQGPKRSSTGDSLLGLDQGTIDQARKILKLNKSQDNSSLACLTHEEWTQILEPSGTESKSSSKYKNTAAQAAQLVARLEKQYPTTAFIANMERDISFFPEERDALLAAFSNQPSLDLAKVNTTKLLRSNTVKTKSGNNKSPDSVKRAMNTIQRVFKLTPTFRQTKTLLDSGIRSAATIHAWGRARFVKQFTSQGTLEPSEANSIFQRATDIHVASSMMAGELQAITAATRVRALSNQLKPELLQAVTQDFPNMKALFQLSDFCACEDCRTVHSAAAYVADTLEFLKHRLVFDTTSPSNDPLQVAKDVLFSRRPDLGDMDLSCANTNTPLPYVDVVCELLEEAVSPDPGFTFSGTIATGTIQNDLLQVLTGKGLTFTAAAVITDAYNSLGERIVRNDQAVCKLTPATAGTGVWTVHTLKQTYGTAQQVAAAPQYSNGTAYDVLSNSDFAFGLPFDLAHQETRAYFTQFAIPRGDLMRALQLPAGPQDSDIAAEDLGLSDDERALITTPDVPNQAKYWNSGSTMPAEFMKNVLTFVTKAAITFVDLQKLISLLWLNPKGALSIKHLDSSCDLDKKEITGLDDTVLDRLHRFIRLWKRTTWTPDILDRLIRADKLGHTQLSNTVIEDIQSMNLIGSQLNLSIDEVCTFYSTIPVGDDTARYSQIFLNPTANGAVDPAFFPSNVQTNESAPAAFAEKLVDHAAYLALCLGTTEPTVQLLIQSLGGSTIVISASNIAAMYSLNRMAKALNIPVKDLSVVQMITGIDPLSSPSNTLEFLAAVKKIQSSNNSPSGLLYILTNQSNDPTIQGMTDDAVLALLENLQTGYQPVVLSNVSSFKDSSTPAENKQSVIDVLSKVQGLAPSDLSKFDRIVNKTWVDPNQTQAQFLDSTLAFLGPTALSNIQGALTQMLKPTAGDAEKNNFFKVLTNALSTWLTNQAKQQVLKAEFQTYFKLAPEVIAQILLNARLRQPASAGNALLVDILTADALNPNAPPLPPITATQFDSQVRAIRLFSVMTLFLQSIKLPADQIGWFLKNSPAFGWLELDNLTYQSDIPPTSYELWSDFQDLLSILESYPPISNSSNPTEPFTMFGSFELLLGPAPPIASFLNYFAQLTGLDPQVLIALDAYFKFSNVDLSPYMKPAPYLKLQTAATILRQLGLTLQPALSLCKVKLTLTESATMRQALKARYSDADWLSVLKAVQDPLRAKKRDALIAYLLAVNPSLQGTDDLYDYYLIDVEMGTCMSTSRVVQAHATIQLFVQRCLMGLEPKSVANVDGDDNWSQWKWMANYRVWEANRKIFLWPENYIDPSLRLDKSELFQHFETNLFQNPLTNDAVESCLQTYLEELEDIGQLDVMACHYDTEALTMHVFARTRGGDPFVYYYRQFQQERNWTSWTKVDLDISGSQLLAFSRNSRLTLAWPVFTEETDPAQMTQPVKIPTTAEVNAPGGKSSDPPKKRWKIQLAVSERVNGKWKAKKISQGAIYSPSQLNGVDQFVDGADLDQAEDFNFFSWSAGATGQAISCAIDGSWLGSFALTGCKGYPEPISTSVIFPIQFLPQFEEAPLEADRFTKIAQPEESKLSILTLFQTSGFQDLFNTAGPFFKVTYPLEISLIDLLLVILQVYVLSRAQREISNERRGPIFQLGTFMPYFYGDFTQTYVIIPGFYGDATVSDIEIHTEVMFSDIFGFVTAALALLKKYFTLWQANPNQDAKAFIATVKADPVFQKLISTFQTWRKTLTYKQKVKNFYHPLICPLRMAINMGGVEALMLRSTQLQVSKFDFTKTYSPQDPIRNDYPKEDLDFTSDGSYSSYNWELFFHIPFEIAMRLNQD